jgi:hypothetical protein
MLQFAMKRRWVVEEVVEQHVRDVSRDAMERSRGSVEEVVEQYVAPPSSRDLLGPRSFFGSLRPLGQSRRDEALIGAPKVIEDHVVRRAMGWNVRQSGRSASSNLRAYVAMQ